MWCAIDEESNDLILDHTAWVKDLQGRAWEKLRRLYGTTLLIHELVAFLEEVKETLDRG